MIDLSITPVSRDDADKLGKALHRFRSEDPTFRVHDDEETSETDHRGHGRAAPGDLRRADPPRVQGRCRSRRSQGQLPRGADRQRRFNFKHKKQTGGSGQYAHVVGKLEPLKPPKTTPRRRAFEFENKVIGGRIPNEYIPSVEKGFRDSLAQGPVAGLPGRRASRWMLEDGSYHDVDTRDMAFQICAANCFRETFMQAKPVLLEPIMKVEVEVPERIPGPVAGDISAAAA